jgi:hypothetical protein
MTAARKLRPREQCDWCHGRLGARVYILFIPGPGVLQIAVGECCARPAAESAVRSPIEKVSRRGYEVLHILEVGDE